MDASELHARVTNDARSEPTSAEPLRICWPGGRLDIDDEPIAVGAHADNAVVIDDPLASGFHCRLFRRLDGRLWVRDLGSTNGTWVDGMRVSEAELSAGSTLRVGGRTLRIERDQERASGALPGMLSVDPVLAPAIELLRRAAPSRVPIVLLGESGCGKEVAARAVHELSPRGRAPFVPVNCGAIAQELAEAELFGHERGAFTGAVSSSLGAFGAADGGTLFLDEVGELPPQLQVKLLRALEAGEVKPVGAARPRRTDVRFLCATHQDLKAAVRQGRFREDLFYRLCGLSVELPPLRARPLDILPLAERFLEEVSDGVPRTFAPDARAELLAHRWPGNVRELRHVVRLSILLADSSPTIRASALRFESAGGHQAGPGHEPQFVGVREEIAHYGPPPEDLVDLRGKTLAEIEEIAVRAACERHGGNRRAIMAELGIAKSSLLRKLDALGLRAED